MPASGTHSLNLLPCFPSIGVPIPLRLPKSTRQNKTTTKKKKKKKEKRKKGGHSCFFCSLAPVSDTHSPVLLPCFPSIGVPVPFRLPKSTHLNKTTTTKKKKMAARFSFVLRGWLPVPAHHSCCPVSLVSRALRMHCVCALVWMAGAGCSAVLGSLSLPADSSPPTGSWGEGRSGPAGPGFVSYPLCEALGSRRC